MPCETFGNTLWFSQTIAKFLGYIQMITLSIDESLAVQFNMEAVRQASKLEQNMLMNI